MKRKLLSALTALGLCTVILIGCSSTPSSSAPTTGGSGSSAPLTTSAAPSDTGEKKTYKFGFTEWAAGSFFDACYQGVMEVVNEKGGEVIRVEAKSDANYQMNIIEDFIAQKVDLVFYNPVDAKASEPALKLLKEANIPVVNFDLAVEKLDMVTAFVATDHYSAGKIAGEQMIKDYPEGGNIAILDRANDNAAVDRVKGLMDAIEGKGFTVVSQLDAGGKPETGLTVMEDILQAHDDLVAVFCINDECAQGAYAAIKAANENVGIYSCNGGPESKAAISKDGANGIWKMTAAQSPFEVGRQSALVAYNILEGKPFEKELLVSTFAITAENIQDYADSDWQ